MPSEEVLAEARRLQQLADLQEQGRLITRWMLKHPDEAAMIAFAEVNSAGSNYKIETLELDRAATYFEAAQVGWCPTCWEATVWFPDSRSLLWPSLHQHSCNPLQEQEAARPVTKHIREESHRKDAQPAQNRSSGALGGSNPSPLDV